MHPVAPARAIDALIMKDTCWKTEREMVGWVSCAVAVVLPTLNPVRRYNTLKS